MPDNPIIRKLRKIKLLNVALTGIPMNESAVVTGTFIKSIENHLKIEGKPFAGYDNFDDCVSKNQDKGNPKAYCADIMRKVEGKEENMIDKSREGLAMTKEENVEKTETKEVEKKEEKVEVKDYTKELTEISESLKSITERLDKIESKEEESSEEPAEDVSEEKSKIESIEAEIKKINDVLEQPELKGRAEQVTHDESEESESGSILTTI